MIHSSQEMIIACAFCKGKGVDPFDLLSSLSRCEACGGTGHVRAPDPCVVCRFCNGTGSYKTYRCPVCQGAGVVAPLAEPTKTCPECNGRASELSSGLECLKCKGRGRVTV